MKSKTHRLATLALIAAAVPCHAGGTLGTDELVPLLSQRPDVYEALNAAFELKDSAFAWVRFGSHYEHLSGRRLGPYEIEAKVRASGKKIMVVLCTEAAYFDERGKVVPSDAEESAYSVKERLTAVLLQSPGAGKRPPCP